MNITDSILTDTGWQFDSRASDVRRGIRDYYREMKVSHALSKEEFQALKTFIEKDSPGWTPILILRPHKDETFLRAYTCWDSSD